MKILVIGRGVPEPSNRMLGSFELEQAEALSKAGNEVIYAGISVRSGKNNKKLWFWNGTKNGIPVYSFNFPLGRAFSYSATDRIFEYAFSKMIRKIEKKYGLPDVIHVHYPAQRPFRCFNELKKRGVKIVATEHWTKVQDKSINPTCMKNLTDFCREADAFICVSSALKQSVDDLVGGQNRIYVVPNLVTHSFTANRESHEGFRFVVSGRLVPVKQVDKVIEAFIHVFDRKENVSLTIAGAGEEYSNLQDIIRSSERENQITLLGSVDRNKMAEVISASDVLVTYSRLETFCVPVIEAWMSGIPVIASNNIPVMIDNKDEKLGICVDSKWIETLEKALVKMRETRDEYDPDYIQQYALNKFSERAIVSRLMEIYKSIGT